MICYEGDTFMKNFISQRMFGVNYDKLPLASEIVVDLVKEKTMWQVMSGTLTLGVVVYLLILIA